MDGSHFKRIEQTGNAPPHRGIHHINTLDANIVCVNTLSSKDALVAAAFAANFTIEEQVISDIKNPHFMRVSDFATWII